MEELSTFVFAPFFPFTSFHNLSLHFENTDHRNQTSRSKYTVTMRFISLLITLILPALSIANKMNMAVAWLNMGEIPGTCSVQEGAAISALMIPAVNNAITSLSVIGGGGTWMSGYEGNRRELLGEGSLESDENEERELCSKCRNACAVNQYECKYVYNCCPCGYCRRLSLTAVAGISASAVALSLENACQAVLQSITSLQVSVNLSSACMNSLRGSVCRADVSLAA